MCPSLSLSPKREPLSFRASERLFPLVSAPRPRARTLFPVPRFSFREKLPALPTFRFASLPTARIPREGTGCEADPSVLTNNSRYRSMGRSHSCTSFRLKMSVTSIEKTKIARLLYLEESLRLKSARNVSVKRWLRAARSIRAGHRSRARGIFPRGEWRIGPSRAEYRVAWPAIMPIISLNSHSPRSYRSIIDASEFLPL